MATTTITVERPVSSDAEDPDGYGYDPDHTTAVETVATGVRATIAPGGASGSDVGGQSTVATHRLACDPVDVTHLDTVLDEKTGRRYRVAWAVEVAGLAGLGHVAAGLTTTEGQAP